MDKAILDTPVGSLAISVQNGMLESIRFVETRYSRTPNDPATGEVISQIRAYFEDPHHRFSVPLHMGGTRFQAAVWRALQDIPSGEIRTYGDIARQLESSPRAVGNACRANPCPVVVPCHRVVAAGGPGGYAGAVSGEKMQVKRWLLAHEGANPSWL